MSRNASLTIDWADGTYTFRIAIGQWAEIAEKTGGGPWFIKSQLEALAAEFSVASQYQWITPYHLREIIRIALVGGGMKSGDAEKLVKRYVDDVPAEEGVLLATAIISTALVGAPEERLGEAQGEAATGSTTSPMAE